jgi:hypothetical protein
MEIDLASEKRKNVRLDLMLVVEVGLRLRQASHGVDGESQSLVETARDGLTVLVSFLLGFSLVMANAMARRQMSESTISATDSQNQKVPCCAAVSSKSPTMEAARLRSVSRAMIHSAQSALRIRASK